MNSDTKQVRIEDCWNRIGVSGDGSCERLREYIHCRHCDVFGAAARGVMQQDLPPDYSREWSAHFARPEPVPRKLDASALVFRIADEWLALPANIIILVCDPVVPRRLPHRTDPAILGLVNVRGRLYPCMTLAPVLQIVDAGLPRQPGQSGLRTVARILVVQFEQLAVAIPVDHVLGVQRYAMADRETPPATLERTARYIDGILSVDEKRIGCLDPGLLGYALESRLK